VFRYVAFSWNVSHATAAALAERLDAECLGWVDWTPALQRPGLHVFTIGARAGVNEVIHLQGGLGVILGKLFRPGALGTRPARNQSLSGAEGDAILRSGGRSLATDFWGRYVAFVQTAQGLARVLRDPSGTLPCFRLQLDGVTLVFSWLEDALALVGALRRWAMNWDALKVCLQGGALSGRQTALEGVLQVLPGESIDLLRLDSELVWRAVDFARSPASFSAAEASGLLREGVQACVDAWASCYDTLLVRLSGGVDSSILISCLAPARTAADVISINYHSRGSDSDERVYARLAAASAGRDLIERERDPGFRIGRVLSSARMCVPIPYVGWMSGASDAQLATAYGAPAMFTGAGGDSLFYEFASWWPASDCLAAQGLSTGFLAAAMDAARLGRVSIWRAIGLAMKERVAPSAFERELTGTAPFLAPEVRTGMEHRMRFLHPSLQDAADIPIGKRVQTFGLLHPLTYYNPFEREAAPELVNPLLSQPLVELCLRLPTYLLTQGGHGRALARQAFAADLPSQIVHRRSKGGLEEHVKAILLSNLKEIRPLLLEGQLARRGLLDLPKVEAVLSGKTSALQGPVSQIHGLVAIEAWISRWPI